MTTTKGQTTPASNAAPGSDVLLRIENLKVEYLAGRGSVRAVDGVSFTIHRGEVIGLAGESGCGKSTVAQAIMRILQPPAIITGGEIIFEGRDVLQMNDRELRKFRWDGVSMVFQSAMNSLNPVATIGDQIIDGIQAHKKVSNTEGREMAAELLEIVGIERDRIDSYPHQLSGGMRQRAVIAIALALQPPLMIMDEPTTALDVVVQREILAKIGELKERFGFSIIFITHDMSLLVEISDRIAIMYAGQIIEMSNSRELFETPLHPYTEGLMGSFPALTGPRRKLEGIPGSPPDLISPPSGCRFHPRCPKRMLMCDRVRPQLGEHSPGHQVRCHLYEVSRPHRVEPSDLEPHPQAIARQGHESERSVS
ncbi:MAG TPA: ABC transporter ATP-binding protein [Thermomicrobiales bacterium]|jgi:peptide/nickel transport system ATP-binding protein|nr:ABC transporter ATP-binding protein [Thermomicrobiales bacterium]